MGKAIRYTVITAIACIMIFGVLIATREIGQGMEYIELPYNPSDISLGPEPSYSDIEMATFSQSATSSNINVMPQQTDSESETETPSAEQTAAETQGSGNKATPTPSPKNSAQPTATSSTGNAQENNTGTATPTPANSQGGSTTTPHYNAPSGYTAFEDSTFYISYPTGWTKASVSGEFSGTTFTSPADSSGDTLKLTLVSTEVNDSDALDVLADSGSEVINEVIAGFGVSASVVEKSFESISIHSSYYILIEVPNGSSTIQIRQNYILHGKILTMVELSGEKGKATKDLMSKILNTFESKQSSSTNAN